MQVYRICPQALLPVVPHLENELQADEDAKRLAAVELVGRLFALPGSDMDAQYASLFSEFVRRFRDLKARCTRRLLSVPNMFLQYMTSSTLCQASRAGMHAAFSVSRWFAHSACHPDLKPKRSYLIFAVTHALFVYSMVPLYCTSFMPCCMTMSLLRD